MLFLNADTMRTAMSLTSEVEDNRRERNDENEELPSLEYRLWRAVATRIAYKVLLDEPAFMVMFSRTIHHEQQQQHFFLLSYIQLIKLAY